MGLHGAYKNGGYSSHGHGSYGPSDYPGHVYSPMTADADHGQKHTVTAYSETQDGQSYVTESKQVVEIRRVPARTVDHDYNPTKNHVYEHDYGKNKGGSPPGNLLYKGSTTTTPPLKDNHYYNNGGHRYESGGRTHYSPTRKYPHEDDHGNGLHSKGRHNYSKTHDYGSEDEDKEVVCEDGVCYVKKKEHNKENRHAPNSYNVPIATHNKPHHFNESPPHRNYNGHSKGEIDCKEASKRYGGVLRQYEEIDSDEAARRYHGIVLSDH